jgi:hypothetical protein
MPWIFSRRHVTLTGVKNVTKVALRSTLFHTCHSSNKLQPRGYEGLSSIIILEYTLDTTSIEVSPLFSCRHFKILCTITAEHSFPQWHSSNKDATKKCWEVSRITILEYLNGYCFAWMPSIFSCRHVTQLGVGNDNAIPPTSRDYRQENVKDPQESLSLTISMDTASLGFPWYSLAVMSRCLGSRKCNNSNVAWSLFPMMQLSCRWDDYEHHFKKVWKLLHGLASSYRHNRVLVNKSGMFLDITNHEWHNPNLVPLSNKYRCYLFDKFSLSMRCYKRLAFKARVFMQGCIRIRLCLLLIER